MTPDGPGPAPEPGGPEVVTVPALLDGVRLDRVVSTVTGVSRSVAADLVTSGAVTVDGRPATQRSAPVPAGSLLAVAVGEIPVPLEPELSVPVSVVHEDPDVVVVDKAAGLVVHPGAGRRTGTLAGGLLARYPDLSGLVEAGLCDPHRPGIVQRLDKGTSGLMVVARTPVAYRSLVDQLTARAVTRRYLALVAGLVAEDQGAVDAPIGRSLRSPTRMGVSAQGREARTGYTVLARYDDEEPLTLLVLALETGRTHQIRVHLAAIGHPVVGDDRYGSSAGAARAAVAASGAMARRLEPGRLFLHAARLGFVHPTSGEAMQWDAPLPADLAGLLPAVPGGW